MTKDTKNKTQKKLKTTEDYENLGRIVASVYESGYLDRAQSYKMSFIKGLFQGLGGVIGATVVVALLIWTLSLFSEVPLLGTIFDSFQNTIEQKESEK